MSDVEKRIEQWRAGLAGSELLGGSDVSELENHLREEIEHLKTSGLSDEEAFLVAQHRLGDTAALQDEFAKVSPHRRLANRLSWMATGVLSYFLILHLSSCVTNASTVLGYKVGLRNPYLTLLACITHAVAFAGIGALAWRYFAARSPSEATARKTSTSVHMGIFAASAIVALYWVENLGHYLLVRTMSPGLVQPLMAQRWVSFGWAMLMPFLAVGLIAIVAL